MVNILQHYLNRNIDVNQMIWAILRRHVKIFLDTTWIMGSQYIIFRDSSIEKLLRQRCLKEDANEIRTLHAFMAEFYRKYSSMKDIATSRVLYHYEEGHIPCKYFLSQNASKTRLGCEQNAKDERVSGETFHASRCGSIEKRVCTRPSFERIQTRFFFKSRLR
jgi:hypothetical protein